MGGFVEGSLEGEKMFGDIVFPKTLVPAKGGGQDLVSVVKTEQDVLKRMLQEHGAILFRDFHIDSAEGFERVAEAFGWGEMDYFGATTRVRISNRVYTANEAPLDQLINFQHEMALLKQSPSKIFFFCAEPSPEGGETSIVPSHIIVDKMEERMPEVVRKVSNVGFVFRIKSARDQDSDSDTIVNKTWKSVLKTDDQVEGEKRARQKLGCSSVEFNDDGSADFVYGPMNPVRELGGKRVWFFPILGYTNSVADINNRFGDGSQFPSEALIAYREILEENCVDVKWQKGDILLVDNFTVQHARRPGKPPRVILVSICK